VIIAAVPQAKTSVSSPEAADFSHSAPSATSHHPRCPATRVGIDRTWKHSDAIAQGWLSTACCEHAVAVD
jgi:hypothetical protein